ncbi:MAG: acetylornithine/succinylornithine family transaminase [Actinobacteria bacterium]|nr:acetylornithine/succinylornithine family transaminase [Actinomycetota bacterium]
MSTHFDTLAALDAAYHLPTYARKPVLFVRGEGMRLYDDEGREYLDFVGGIGSVNLGHAHPAVADAVCAQMRTLVQVTNLYHTENRALLAERLSELAGGEPWKAFFCNSGTEAIEGVIKLARKWGKVRRGEECIEIITAERSFHGRTMAALSATGQPSKQDAFAPLLPGFVHVPLNDIAALEAAITGRTCAVLLEPVQGEGGVYPCEEAYLEAARQLCDERDVLLAFDEVQTGFFRTGPAFAWQGYGVRPDVMALAKSLANGLPAGAVLATGSAAETFAPGDHGSTFGGGPVIAAAALATIEALESEGLGANAQATGAALTAALTALAADTGAIAEVRGRGLMVAAELAEPVAQVIAARCLERGVVINAIGERVLRFLSPLVCSPAEAAILVDTLRAVLGAA